MIHLRFTGTPLRRAFPIQHMMTMMKLLLSGKTKPSAALHDGVEIPTREERHIVYAWLPAGISCPSTVYV